MGHIATEELLKRCGSVYRLVLLAAKRTKEVAEGSPPLIVTQQKKAGTVALEEIMQGKVLYYQEPEEGSTKKRREGKTKTKKRTAV